MRHVKWIFVVLIAGSLTSFVEKNNATEGLNVGDVAPDFDINSTSSKTNNADFALSKLKGKYVLLSFWASYDAQSRMQNVQLSNLIKSSDLNVEMVSISFDEFSSIYKETVRMDQIERSNCFWDPKGESSLLFKEYNLNKGFNNFLLDDNGVILAKNISAIELPTFLKAVS